MEKMALWGAIVNVLAVVFGGLLGLLLRRFLHSGEGRLGETMEKCSDAIMKGIGLCCMVIGISGALKSEKMLVMILSVIVGGILGTLLDLDGKINRLGNFLGEKLSGKGGMASDFSAGFVNATLLFCVGAMSIVGPMESGLRLVHTTQYAKSIMDGVMAIVFASSFGVGVLFSGVSILLYQGSLTLLAQWVQPILSDAVITEMSAAGSLLILGIGLNLAGITKLKLMNYIPAMFLPILFCLFM
jgi:uncharacterized membrane protein YqgA involved in biofilm formation